MKIRRILTALLALSLLGMLAALAACGNEQAADTPLTVKPKITAAEVEQIWLSLRFENENATEAEALRDLLEQRIYIWETDSLGLLPDIEDARRQVQQGYETIRSGAADTSEGQTYGAVVAWEVLQEYLAYTGFSEEEYLEMAAEKLQSLTAENILHEQVLAELSPAADEYEQAQAVAAYDTALIEKYQAYALVEDDLLPLLEEMLENWSINNETE